MPNHVHALLHPLGKNSLSAILHSWKSYTAKEANRLLQRAGQPFWQKESYDRCLRDDEEFARVYSYVKNNPVKAGLCATAEDWPWSSASQKAIHPRTPPRSGGRPACQG